jgi:membrane protease YdiL (CAAX protease family)
MVLLYPFLSAFPQELIFREFFFYRYRNLFRKPQILIAVNIIVFAFAHVYFMNWIVIVFTLVGGALFALTYHQTRSLLVVTLEHSIYGLVILSSGLWEYFYKAF